MKYLFILLLILLSNIFSFGIVLHPEGEPNESWIDKPLDSVLAKVGSCSGVVIHPQYILTVDHFSVSYSTAIYVDNQIYYPEEIYSHENKDIRLIKVEDANFLDFVDIPEQDLMSEEYLDKNVIIGGFGESRGEEVYASYDAYLLVGYSWSGSRGNLLWGTNEIDSYSPSSISVYFNELFKTPYECGLAVGDSGGGCFYYSNGQWWTIALGQSVHFYGYDYFLNPYADDPNFLGTFNSFIRIYPMRGWIESIIYKADFDKDGYVDELDLMLFSEDWLAPEDNVFNYRADINRDGYVNFLDFAIFASEWKK